MKKLLWLIYLSPFFSFSQNVNFSSKLPIVIINTDNQIIQDEPRIVADMGIIYNPNEINYYSDVYNDYNGKISIEIRGSSSQFYPKKSFSIETQKLNGENLNTSLLGLPSENDWILYGPYYDKTLIRNTLTYSLFSKMGHYSPRAKYCELFINDSYFGVYVLIEKIKKDTNRVNISSNNENDVSGGFIIKIDHMNIDGNSVDSYEYWDSNYSSIGGDDVYFQYYYPKPDEITDGQKNYIQNYINNFEDCLNSSIFTDLNFGYKSIIDINSAIDFFIIQEFSKNIDAYRASTFFYKDETEISDKLYFGPVWDFNFSYGATLFCEGDQYEGWQNNSSCGQANPIWFKRFREDPYFAGKLNCRWEELRANILSVESLGLLIDSLTNSISESVLNNFEAWGDSITEEGYNMEVLKLKTWILNRLDWMDSNLDECLDEYNTSTQNKTIIKVIDILGREVNEKPFIPLIDLYDDGSSQKRLIIE